MLDNKYIKWIMATNARRWLCFLPLTILSAFLGSMILELINLNTIGRLFSSDTFFFKLYSQIFSGLIFGAIFVYVGGYIAPIKKIKSVLFYVVIILTTLILVGDLFFAKKTHIDSWTYLYIFCMVIGSYLGRKYLEDEENKESPI